MTLKQLASLIAKREGLKHEASIGDVREILSDIIDLEVEDSLKNSLGTDSPLYCLAKAANQRYLKALKKKK